jgi:hypothetical protein
MGWRTTVVELPEVEPPAMMMEKGRVDLYGSEYHERIQRCESWVEGYRIV